VNHLLRSHAPITDIAWSRLDAEGRERLVPALGARKLVDFSGPLGWGIRPRTWVGCPTSRLLAKTCRPANDECCRLSSFGLLS